MTSSVQLRYLGDAGQRDQALAFHWRLKNRGIWTPLGLQPATNRDAQIAQEQILLKAILAFQIDVAGVRYSRRLANYVGL